MRITPKALPYLRGDSCTLQVMVASPQSPDEFAREMHERLQQDGALQSLAFETIRSVVNVAFYASLETEESKSCTFSLVCVDQQLKARAPTHAWCFSALAEDSPLSVSRIAKLSPACDPEQTHIAVDVTSGEPRICGIVRTNRDGERIARGERDTVDELPVGFLVVRAFAPGVLEVRNNGVRLGLLSKGTRLESAVALFGSGWFFELMIKAAAAAQLDHQIYRTVLQSILHRLVRRKCGGTILLVRDAPNEVKISNAFKPASEALRDSIRFAMRLNVPPGPPRDAVALQPWVKVRSPYQLADMTMAISDVASFAADLAGVDGALVLTHDLQIVGFGAKITAPDEPTVTALHAKNLRGNETTLFSSSGLGTRHNSAIRWCYHNQGSVALVVSQDQTVSCLVRPDGRSDVLVWRPVMLEVVPTHSGPE